MSDPQLFGSHIFMTKPSEETDDPGLHYWICTRCQQPVNFGTNQEINPHATEGGDMPEGAEAYFDPCTGVPPGVMPDQLFEIRPGILVTTSNLPSDVTHDEIAALAASLDLQAQ